MTKIAVFLAEGFEEMEAIIPIDIWRRAEFDVETISISSEKTVTGAHNIPIIADAIFEDSNFQDIDMLFLPGGIPGSTNLDEHAALSQLLLSFNTSNKKIVAICAAPLVLGHKGLLKGKNATCFPGFEKELIGANYTSASIQIDNNIITGKGAGVAFELALEVVTLFKNQEFAQMLAQKMQMKPINV